MLLSVIIVNYNVKYYLEQCLRSVLKAGEKVTMEVIVVDNHSSDGSRQYLQPLFPQVQFIWQTSNPGFAKACNLGLTQSVGEYILFLNPDTLVPEDCFVNLIKFFTTHNNAGAVGVHMVDGRGLLLKESKRGYPSTIASFFKLSGLIKLFPRSAFFAKYYLGHLPETETHKVDVLSGAFMAMPKAVAEAMGGFDEAFFMYGEDIDLSYRIARQGLNNYYFPGISIIHFKGESTSKQSLQYTRHFYTAMEIFVRKYYSATASFFYTLCIRGIIAIKSFFKILTPVATPRGIVANTLIVIGEEKNVNAVVALYKQTVNARLEESRVIVTSCWNTQLEEKSVEEKTDVLFCIGALSMGAAIKMLQAVKASGSIYFHYVDSQRMVCGSAG